VIFLCAIVTPDVESTYPLHQPYSSEIILDCSQLREGLFERFKDLVEISICKERSMVPENNKLLRCFQYIKMDTVSVGDYCWNGECTNCLIWYRTEEGELKSALACRLYVRPGMEITGLSDALKADLAG
jgi:hypothetical protein